MANIFRSDEIYKNFRYDIDKTKKVVPVQGVYIASEYRPPYYTEPILRIFELTSEHATIVSFQDVELDASDGMVKILDFGMELLNPTLIQYTTEDVSTTDGMVKILDFGIGLLEPTYDFYKTVDVSDTDCMTKIIDFGTEFFRLPQPAIYSKRKGNSTPEPILRLTSITSESSIIENYT